VTTYIRFSTLLWDSDSTKKLGILVAAHELRDSDDISKGSHSDLVKALRWINENLEVPKILKKEEHRRAISWFKPEAKVMIQKMWELVAIMRENGIEVEILKTDDPGNVLYEDRLQIIAKPRKGKRVPW